MMFKKAFTLQELLVTLGVIGIVAAITIPALINTMPDENKARYIKTYNTLSSLVSESLDDQSLYWYEYSDQNGELLCGEDGILTCDGKPLIEPYSSSYVDGFKLPLIIQEKLNIAESGDIQPNSPVPPFTPYPTTFIVTKKYFVTTDGTRFDFGIRDANVGHDFTVTFPRKNNQSNDCSWDEIQCTAPNQFVIRVQNDGAVLPQDAMGWAYLQNPTNLKTKSADIELAKTWKNETEE